MTTISEFIESMKSGPIISLVPILDIPNYYDSIIQYLRNTGLSGEELDTELRIKNSLRAICPMCDAWADGTLLNMLSLIKSTPKENVLLTNYGAKSRLLNGLCQNEDCSCKDILLIWNGNSDITSHIEATFERIQGEKRKPIQKFIHPKIITYVADAIFVQKQKQQQAHLFCGRSFSDIWIWVSVLPNVSEASLKYTFPKGYCAFFDDLLADSGYDSENVAVMHWTYVSSDMPLLHLAFLNTKHQPTQPGSMVLPIDLLNNNERKQLGLN